ncbi:MAG: hypothetical protein UW66_C0007G0002 [Candidatus Moranbacteria bacterium GW2011_GWF1_44_4]|nr:MAG: hypothetical protein UW66_C0007G0002 [Candidatus Moranbacteria bacterium GW2011_GWF1_44_4]
MIDSLQKSMIIAPFLEGLVDTAVGNLKIQLRKHTGPEPPAECPDCGGKLEKATGHREVIKGDLKGVGDCKKFFFFVIGQLRPGHND